MKSDESVIPKQDAGEALEYDPEFKGPVKKRSCTDIICLFLFISFVAGWFVVAGFAFRQGDPKTLIYPSDSEGNICGVGEFADRKFLFYFDILKCASASVLRTGCLTPQVCVEHCPNETFFAMPQIPEIYKSKLICQYNVDTASKTLMELANGVLCAQYYIPSTPFKVPTFAEELSYDPRFKEILLRRCIPDQLTQQGNKTVDHNNVPLPGGHALPPGFTIPAGYTIPPGYTLPAGPLPANNPSQAQNPSQTDQVTPENIQKAVKLLARFLSIKETGEQIFSDFKTAWPWIFMFLVLSMLLSFIWIVLMRWVAGIMVWLSLFIVLAFCGAGCYFSAKQYQHLKQVSGSNTTIEFTTNFSSYLGMRDTWLALAIILGALFAIFLLVLIFLRKRIFIAIALIKEASRAVSCMMTSLLFPILPYFLQLVVFLWALIIALYIASSGKASFVIMDASGESSLKNGTVCDPRKYNSTGTGPKCIFRDFGVKDNIFSAHAYNALGLFWGVFFAVGLGQVSLSGAFAAYYWTFNKAKDLPRLAVAVGLYRCLRYHLGSVALGSLIIAIVRMIRVGLEYIDQKCKTYDNAVTKAIICCMKCCFWLLEKVLRFITKNAYIMIAVYGENFCSSGRRAVKLLWRNVVRAVIIDKVCDFLLFMGKLVVLAFAATTSFYFFVSGDERLGQYTPQLHFNLIPPLFITFGAYVIASGFFSVYGMAVDTLFLCFLEDCERNDGSKEKPYYMSKELMLILNKKNKLQTPSSS